MGKLQAYTKYQPVEYDYVSQLPEDWQLLPNIAIFQERIERGHDNEELLSVTIGKGVIRQSDVDIKKDSSNEDKSKYKLIKVGDIAYNRMRMWQGALGYSNYQGITSPAYVVLKPKMKINQRFFHYMLRANFYTNYSKRFSYGIVDDQLSLRYVDFKRMYSIVPPLETQNGIVAYLDRKTQQIQEFIAKKERLIELLEEEMHSRISKVITKGTRKVALSDKLSEWTGAIPEHWTFIQLGYILSYISYGFTNPMTTTDEGPYMLTANDVGDGEIFFDTCRRTSLKEFNTKLSPKSIPYNGDILVTKDGTLGRTSLFNGGQTCINQSVALLRVNEKKALNTFIENVLRSKCYLDKMVYDAEGTTIKHIYITKLIKMKIGLPPIEEQQEINTEIEKLRLEANKIITKIEIELLKAKEYQESLITQIVTGQLKVPENVKSNLGQDNDLGMVAEPNTEYRSNS